MPGERTLNLGTIFTADPSQFIAALGKLKAALGGAQQAYTQAGKAQDKAFKGAPKAVDQTTKSVRKSGSAMLEYSKQIGKVEGAWKRVLAAAKVTASYGLAASAIFAVVRAFGAGAREIIDYDQALKNLQAITRATDSETAAMGDTIQEVAKNTKFSTGEVAEGMVLLGQAGLTATEAMDSMQAVADLATGTLSNLATTSDLVTTAIRAFNLDAVESTRVADVMANAINRSKLTLDKLRISFNFVGAAAAQTGLSLEETAAAMMVLANHGIRASTIGTGLRQTLARLLAPNRRLREAFKEQGVELDKVNPRLVGFQKAMLEVRKVLYDSERNVIDMGKAYELFGLRGAQAAAILAKSFGGTGPGSYKDMLDKTYEVGSAAAMAGLQAEGLGVKLKNLADRAKLIAVAFGEAGAVGIIGGFVDALRGAATAIASFIKSDIGGLVTSTVLWTGVIITATKVIISLAGAIRGLGAAILASQIPIFAIEMIKVVQAAGLARAAVWALNGAMAGALGPIAAIAATISAVVIIFRYWRGETDRLIKSHEILFQEASKVSNTLNMYSGALDKVLEKHIKGNDVTKEYGRILTTVKGKLEEHLKHLEKLGASEEHINAVKEAIAKLSVEYDDNAEAIRQNSKALKDLYKVELVEKIKEINTLIGLYSKKAEEAQVWTGVWNTALKLLKGWLDLIILGYKKLIAYATWPWRTGLKYLTEFVNKLAEVFPSLTKIGEGLTWLTDLLENLTDRIKNYFKEAGKDSDEAKKALEGVDQKVQELTDTFKGSGLSIEEYINLLRQLGTSEEVIDKVTKALEEQAKQAKITKDEFKETIEKLPPMFEDYYKKLDAYRQAAFTQMIKQMNNELAAYEKQADLMNHTDRQRASVRAAIQAKSLADFIDKNEKELESVEERYNLELDLLEDFSDSVKEHYESKIQEIEKFYDKQIQLARDANEDTTDLEKERADRIKNIRETLAAELSGIEDTANRLRLEREEEYVKELVKLQKEMTKEISKELKNRIKEAEKAAKAAGQVRKKITKKASDALSELEKERRGKDLNEEQKYWAKLQEIWGLIEKARRVDIKESEDLYAEAIDKAKDLPGEVTDSTGRVIKSLEDTYYLAMNTIQSIQEEVRRRTKAIEVESKKTVKDAKADMEALNETTRDFSKAIDEVNRKKLVLQTEEALHKIKVTYDIVSQLKSKWDSIKSKTVTLNIKTQGLPSDYGHEYKREIGGLGGRRWGGLVGYFKTGGKILFKAIKRAVGGSVKPFVGKLRGYGGGDIVQAYLEPGEFVNRKESVAKYGEGFFNLSNEGKFDVGAVKALMDSTLYNTDSPVKAVEAKTGGMIAPYPSSNFKIPKFAFQGGGSVHNVGRAEKGGITIEKIEISPMFMTGDRSSMKRAAVEIKKSLEELNTRWGVRNG